MLQNVKQSVLFDPAFPLLGICPKAIKMYVSTNTYAAMFIVALLIIV